MSTLVYFKDQYDQECSVSVYNIINLKHNKYMVATISLIDNHKVNLYLPKRLSPVLKKVILPSCISLAELPYNGTNCYIEYLDATNCREVDVFYNNGIEQISDLPHCGMFDAEGANNLQHLPKLPKCHTLYCNKNMVTKDHMHIKEINIFY